MSAGLGIVVSLFADAASECRYYQYGDDGENNQLDNSNAELVIALSGVRSIGMIPRLSYRPSD
jgi:hypothetical protein